MSLDLMTGNIFWSPKDSDFQGQHAKSVSYDDVRRILTAQGNVDYYFEDTNEVLSLWLVKDVRGGQINKPPTHIAILTSEQHTRDNWFVVEEQQFYLCDEEKAVVTFVSRLHQDNWKEYDKTGALFPDTTIEGKTEAQFNADKAAEEATRLPA